MWYLQEYSASKLPMVNSGIEAYVSALRQEAQNESPHIAAGIESYTSLLQRGGKRIRGILTITGYEIYDGTDADVITAASGAVEALHAFALVLDDCADKDMLRRGGPSSQAYMHDYLQSKNATGDTNHGSMHLALTGAFIAQYKAFQVMDDLDVSLAKRHEVRSLINQEFIRTGKGQMLDLYGTHVPLSPEEGMRAAQYKTAHYSFLLPLQIGAVLAGASRSELQQFVPYAHYAGVAFQLRDDVIGIFGTEMLTGKSQVDDIAGRKQTWLMNKALELANQPEQHVLKEALGNTALTSEGLKQCQDIIRTSGALDETEQLIDDYTQQAIDALAMTPKRWSVRHVHFLRNLALYGAQRTS